MKRSALVLSCEHGGNRVPAEWAHLFVGARSLLASHRGWDPGALAMARVLARCLSVPLFAADVTRLLVDLNRSPTNPRVFSRFTRELPAAERGELLARWHAPHRGRVTAAIDRAVARGEPVLHVAVHSFTPVLGGKVRTAEIGLLYDPSRARERDTALGLRAALRELAPTLRVRMNYPYRGTSDGLTRVLRERHRDRDYAGIELELGQRLLADGRRLGAVRRALWAAIARVINSRGTAGSRR